MKISITARNLEVGDALRTAATSKVERLTRFLDGMDHAEVRFSEERNPRIAKSEHCEVTMFGHGHYVRAKADAPDALAAVDIVVDKLEHQLTRLKGRLVRHANKHAGKQRDARLPDGSAGAGGLGADASAGETSDDGDENFAKIVKTKQFVIRPITAEEAALQMDLLQHDFFLFTNAETGRAAVIYRRDDGHLGLIDAVG